MAEPQPTRETGLVRGLRAWDAALVTIAESLIGLGLLALGVPACLFSRVRAAEGRDRA